MPSEYGALRCGAEELCAALKRLLAQSRFPRAAARCQHVMLVPKVHAYDATLIGSFFRPFGFDVSQFAVHSSRDGASSSEDAVAADPSRAAWAYVPLGTARLHPDAAARVTARTLVVAGLSIGDKAGLCRVARRAEALWPYYAANAPTPRCLRWPADAALAQAELHSTGAAPWVFKDTAGSLVPAVDWHVLPAHTYGGLSICLYTPLTDSTKQLVLNKEQKWALQKSPPVAEWSEHLQWSKRRGVFQQLVRPLLYDKRAHCFRVFVLVTSTLPLRAWWWRESYAMMAGLPYEEADQDDLATPADFLKIFCATIVNSGFEKEHCKLYRNIGYKLFMRKLPRFVRAMAEGLDIEEAELWARIERAMRLVLLADAAGVVGSRGQCLLGLDMVIDESGHVYVFEANRTPGTTEDTAGRKRAMHTAWATITGQFDGGHHEPRWSACATADGTAPACQLEARLDAFAEAAAANASAAEAAGLRPGGLERALLFEHEREVARLAELAQKGGFQPLYPTSAATLRETEGYLALLRNRTSEEVARVAAAAHALLLRYLEWKEGVR